MKKQELELPLPHVQDKDKTELMKRVDNVLLQAQRQIVSIRNENIKDPSNFVLTEDYQYADDIAWKLWKLQSHPERLIYHDNFAPFAENPKRPESVYTTFRALKRKEMNQ